MKRLGAIIRLTRPSVVINSVVVVLLGGYVAGTGAWGKISLAIAPSNPDRVYALIASPSDAFGSGASTQGAYRSDDGGTSWTSLPVGSVQSFGWYYSLVSVDPTNANTVFFGIRDAYHTLVMKGRYPPVVLYLEMGPERVDVNVHPAKREVRFREARLVGTVVTTAVGRALRDLAGELRRPASEVFGARVPSEVVNK